MIRYKCLCCGGALEKKEHYMSCTKCKHKYCIKDGIKIFDTNTNYYGDLCERDMKNLLKEMDYTDWKELVYKYFANSYPFLYYIITDNNRADWHYLVPLEKESIVLDVGTGWGTLAFPISYRAKVVALDGTFDRLSFVKKRTIQENNKNIFEFVNANILELPFSDCQFDLVILNGVLEWVGASVNHGNPYDLQLKALQNVYSILKEGGYIYIGIENRYGFKYLLGAEDDHTMLPEICYLERDKANAYSKQILGREYRTYTYDKIEYSCMLKQIGFEEIKFYYPYPDYKTIQVIMDLDGKVVRYWNENILKKDCLRNLSGRIQVLENIAAKVSNIENYISSYGILARKGEISD
ncbi:class I SAM-dependent methyltransferase [Thermotalea metallivorans]|uniref:class I SAM-dependent methyltransferase n=1 Tax=Thermotalea metallivorans TaxID=520762 RepID=UPI0018DBD0CC|nr:class I SAM-dependent methyltransferase [Thermotalea metallivorans]